MLPSCSSVNPPFTIAPEELLSVDAVPLEEPSDVLLPSVDVPSDAALPSVDVLPSAAVVPSAAPSEEAVALPSADALPSEEAAALPLPAVLAAEPFAALFRVESPRIAKLSTDS